MEKFQAEDKKPPGKRKTYDFLSVFSCFIKLSFNRVSKEEAAESNVSNFCGCPCFR